MWSDDVLKLSREQLVLGASSTSLRQVVVSQLDLVRDQTQSLLLTVDRLTLPVRTDAGSGIVATGCSRPRRGTTPVGAGLSPCSAAGRRGAVRLAPAPQKLEPGPFRLDAAYRPKGGKDGNSDTREDLD